MEKPDPCHRPPGGSGEVKRISLPVVASEASPDTVENAIASLRRVQDDVLRRLENLTALTVRKKLHVV